MTTTTTTTTIEAAEELLELGRKIAAWQEAKSLTDAAMVRRFAGLGSPRTYRKIKTGDLEELDVEKQCIHYRAVWALIESVGDMEARGTTLYDDMSAVVQLRKVLLEVMVEQGGSRFVLVEGDTGLGKTAAARVLLERYGQRMLYVEATEVWHDRPAALLSAVLRVMGLREIPASGAERLRRVLECLQETRVCLIVDELHHCGPRCLNTIKTILNQTPGEVIGLAMPTLWRRLEREAYEEARQLTGNRLAERIKLALRERDVALLIERLVGRHEGMATGVRLLMDRAARYGNLAFCRDVCARVRVLADGQPDAECWTTAVAQELASR